jgi:hypothetical protein
MSFSLKALTLLGQSDRGGREVKRPLQRQNCESSSHGTRAHIIIAQLAHEPVPARTKLPAQLADPRRGNPEHSGNASSSDGGTRRHFSHAMP